MPDQVPNQGLRYRAVDPVHRHMIPVVGRPAKSQLRKVPRSDHQGVELVCQVHQHLGPFARLTVLVGDIQHLRVVTDILEVLTHSLGDGDGAQLNTQSLCQLGCIALGAFGGAKSRHRYRNNVLAFQAQQVEGPYGDQKGKGRVESSAEAYHHAFAEGVLKTLFQPQSLQSQNLLAPSFPTPLIRGHEGSLLIVAGQCTCTNIQGERNAYIAFRALREALQSYSLQLQFLYIYLGDQKRITHIKGLTQALPVLVDKVVGGEHQVGRRFTVAGITIQVCTDQLCTLAGNERPAVLLLAYQFITGRTVGYHRCSSEGVGGAGGERHPKVLTYLIGHHQLLKGGTAEKQVSAEPGFLPKEGNLFIAFAGSREPTLLIELLIVGEMALGNHGKQLSLVDAEGTVVEHPVDHDRRAEHNKHIDVLAHRKNGGDSCFPALLQALVQKQVRTAVGSGDQLRENKDFHLLPSRFRDERKNAVRIEGGIGHPYRRRCNCTLDEPVFHTSAPPRSRMATTS
ncbi:hypothetical protein SDC9_91111 [bioreactor metagenome]|uniref:Uncharacterized protein n=1 Tax=bioreactor metagenome TaxID=1076179 RepID=A0A645A0Q2_9ZZZZ